MSDFSGGQKPPIRGLTIIESSWNSGNLPYLVANTYGLNFIKMGGMWIFKGAEAPIRWGLHVTCEAHLRNWPSYSSQKSWLKIWFGLAEPFKSYRVHKHTHKKKTITDATENNILGKILFRRIIIWYSQDDDQIHIQIHMRFRWSYAIIVACMYWGPLNQ